MIGVQIEGNLIAPDMTTDLLAGEIKGQTPEDFNFVKTDKLADEIAIAWGDAKAYWAAFQRRLRDWMQTIWLPVSLANNGRCRY